MVVSMILSVDTPSPRPVVKFIANIKSPLLSVNTAPNGAYALPANCSQLDGEPGGFELNGD